MSAGFGLLIPPVLLWLGTPDSDFEYAIYGIQRIAGALMAAWIVARVVLSHWKERKL